MGGRALCFMTNVSAEVWTSVAQTGVALLAIIVGTLAFIYQVKAQARQHENRERAALRQRLTSFCNVAQSAETMIWTAASYMESVERVHAWNRADQSTAERRLVGDVLRSLDMSAFADARHLLGMKYTIQAFNDADAELSITAKEPAAFMGHDIIRAKRHDRLMALAGTMQAHLRALAKERDALVPL